MAASAVPAAPRNEAVIVSSLAPCPGCSRHLKPEESACPFCGAALVVPRCSGRCAGSLPPRLRQAALAAAGAALLGAACQSGTNVMPPYGTPPHVDTGVQSHVDAGASTDATHDAGDAEK